LPLSVEGEKKKTMATGKKTTTNAAPAGAEFTVVLEDLRSQFRVFGEALQGLREEFTERFDAVDQRFAGVDQRFDGVDREIGLVKATVLENGREIRELRAKVVRIEDGAA
jgi:hypothetical protein